MRGGRRGAAAVLGAGALGLGVWALLSARHSAATRGAELADGQARKIVGALAAGVLREGATEATAAAAVPQLRAALKARVDALTLEDLFASEDWWLPHRDRRLTITGLAAPLNNVRRKGSWESAGDPAQRGAGAGAGVQEAAALARLQARARDDGTAAAVVRTNGSPLLVGASVIDGVPGPPVLSLARVIDRALLRQWSGGAAAELAITDGGSVLVTREDRPAISSLPGQETRPSTLIEGGAAVAAAAELDGGLWLWAVRPVVASPGGGPFAWWRWALAGSLAVSAAVLARSHRRGRGDGDRGRDAAGSEVRHGPRTSSLDGGGRGGQGEAVAAEPMLPTGRRSGANAPTLIGTEKGGSFGRYSLVTRIGEGGMSEIYLATLSGAEGFQRALVIKRLKPDLAYNRSAVDQFIDEAKLGSLLVHSNIVQVFDFGKVDDGYYMALEHIVGRNVGQIVERHVERVGAPLDLSAVFFIANEVLQALAYAHTRLDDDGEPLGIVHRDVSPGNIVVASGGEVKLIDFGIVKAEVRVSRTDLGNVKGNPAFMAPEQARGQTVDARSDLFSLGLVMYQALTNQVMYQGNTSAETLYKAAGGPVSHDFDRIGALPPPAARVLSRALAPRAEDRYQSAEEFAADLADEIKPGAKGELATLMNALFGPELRPGGTGTGGGGMAAARRSSGFARKRAS